MNLLKQKMIDLLIDLKINHHAVGVKTEFEDEGATFEEAGFLKEIARAAELDFTIKIGGCSALNDINQAKKIGVNSLVAPMVESAYALKKYICAVKSVFSKEELEKIDFYINIETVTGYNNFESILLMPESIDLTGIIVGRSDMAMSMGLTYKDTNCAKIFEMVTDLIDKSLIHDKKVIIGGGVSRDSLMFLKRLPKGSLQRFETRKIIFDIKTSLISQYSEAILKALEFEIMWIENKQKLCCDIKNKDVKRIESLKNRCKQFI